MHFPLLNQVVAQAGGGDGGGGMGMLIPIVLMFAIIYFLMIRPQQKQAKKHKEMLETLKRGDQVVTNGGLIGKIFQINENNIVTLEVAEGVRVRVLRGQIASSFNPEGEAEKKRE